MRLCGFHLCIEKDRMTRKINYLNFRWNTSFLMLDMRGMSKNKGKYESFKDHHDGLHNGFSHYCVVRLFQSIVYSLYGLFYIHM